MFSFLSNYIYVILTAILFAWSAYLYFGRGYDPRKAAFKSLDFFEATPARQLVPLFDTIIRENDTLIITSSSGDYAQTEPGGLLWIDALRKWLKLRVKIIYLLADGQSNNCKLIGKLALNYPELFSIKYCPLTFKNDHRLYRLANKYSITHPVLLIASNGSSKALWLERYHVPGYELALDVSYISPKDIENSTLAHDIRGELEEIVEQSEELKPKRLKMIVDENDLGTQKHLNHLC